MIKPFPGRQIKTSYGQKFTFSLTYTPIPKIKNKNISKLKAEKMQTRSDKKHEDVNIRVNNDERTLSRGRRAKIVSAGL